MTLYETDFFNEFTENMKKTGIDIQESLKTLSEMGHEEWHNTQDKKWRCKKCGKSIIVSELKDRCHWRSEEIDTCNSTRTRFGG